MITGIGGEENKNKKNKKLPTLGFILHWGLGIGFYTKKKITITQKIFPGFMETLFRTNHSIYRIFHVSHHSLPLRLLAFINSIVAFGNICWIHLEKQEKNLHTVALGSFVVTELSNFWYEFCKGNTHVTKPFKNSLHF